MKSETLNEFTSKTAFVTGASRGIGASAALALARAGAARVVIHYHSHREGAEATMQAVRAAGAEVAAIQADLAEEAGIETCLAALEKTAPRVDLLINNAGSLIERVPFAEYPSDLFDRVMRLNVKSAWRISQALAPGMVARRSGAIVFVSSIAARNGGGPGATVYAAAKAAVSAMTKGLARELAPYGVRVNAISPGTVDNDFHRRYSTREMLERVVAQTPLGRLATNEEMAEVIVFLCSEASRYIIGQTIEINGGMYMI